MFSRRQQKRKKNKGQLLLCSPFPRTCNQYFNASADIFYFTGLRRKTKSGDPHSVEWSYKKLDQLHNPEPYLEIGLKQDVPLLQSCNASQQQLACDVKGSERWTDGFTPVDLYQVGSYGSCLSAVRSRLLRPMERVFNSKGAVKMSAVKSFQGGNHINKKASW